MGTGKQQSIKITASSGLSEQDIQRLVREAEAHASDDKKKQELIEARNHADSLIYGTEKSLADLGDKADAAVRSDIEEKIASLRKLMEGRTPPPSRAPPKNWPRLRTSWPSSFISSRLSRMPEPPAASPVPTPRRALPPATAMTMWWTPTTPK